MASANIQGFQRDSVTGALIVSGALADSQALTTGEETISRTAATTSGAASTGALRLAFFTAKKTELVTNIEFSTASVAAGATPTLIRYGLWLEDPTTGTLTLVASTPNDLTLLTAINTSYPKAVSVPYAKIAGQRYAMAVLVVTAAAAPNILGGVVPANKSLSIPRIAATVSGQADLPSSIAVGSLGITATMPYGVTTP